MTNGIQRFHRENRTLKYITHFQIIFQFSDRFGENGLKKTGILQVINRMNFHEIL